MTKTPAAYPVLSRAQLGGASSAEYADIHTSSDPRMVAILSGIKEYVAARRAVLDFDAYRRSFRPPAQTDAVAVLETVIFDSLQRGDGVPEDLTAHVPDIAGVPVFEGRDHSLGIILAANGTESLTGIVVGRAIDRLRPALVGHLDATLSQHSRSILKGVSGQVEDLIARARKVLTAGGRIVDAEDAIDQDRVEEYRHSQELTAAYVELRRLQLYWLNRSGIPITVTGQRDLFHFYVSNPLEIWPAMPRVVTGRPYRDPDQEKAFRADPQRQRAPWPSSWVDEDAVWWFAAHPEAKAWTPTPGQYDQMLEDLADAAHAHRQAGRRDKSSKRVPSMVVPS